MQATVTAAGLNIKLEKSISAVKLQIEGDSRYYDLSDINAVIYMLDEIAGRIASQYQAQIDNLKSLNAALIEKTKMGGTAP